MLNDTVIQFFQSLFDGINGLQDPLLGQHLTFKCCKTMLSDNFGTFYIKGLKNKL